MIHISGKVYEIIYENKNGWNADAFRDRYSEVLDRYDYIVGDWGYNQLRLKGFLRDTHNKATKDCAYSSLSDYINEYCNFGCAYFVLEKVGSSRKPEDELEAEDLDAKPAKDQAAAIRYPVDEDGADEPAKPVRADRPEPAERPGLAESGDRPEGADRVDWADRSERVERPDRPERADRADRPERAERPEGQGRAERQGRADRSERGDRPERADRADSPERAERQGRADRSERGDRPERVERLEKQERFERADKPNRHPNRERGHRYQSGQAEGEGGANGSSQRKSYRPNHRNKKPFRPAKDDVAAASEDNQKPPRKDTGRS